MLADTRRKVYSAGVVVVILPLGGKTYAARLSLFPAIASGRSDLAKTKSTPPTTHITSSAAGVVNVIMAVKLQRRVPRLCTCRSFLRRLRI